MIDFSTLNLVTPIQNAIKKAGYSKPTPIQCQAIPPLLEGRDLLGIAQTGTGKTAAFALPILNRLVKNPRRAGPQRARVLVLTPTRELASQIDASFATYGASLSLSRTVIFGGVSQNPQVRTMSRGVDVLTATPGRLLDLIGQRFIKLDQLEIFVLDEADRMLDMGFIHDIRKIIAMLPPERQTLLFSATMPREISTLAEGLLDNPVRTEVTPQATTVERVEQQVMFVDRANKRNLLRDILSRDGVSRALVFTRTKHAANRVAEDLEKAFVSAAAIHGNKSQGARERALADFRSGQVRVLVATDIAARGIDVEGVSHVINFDLPNEPESYVHRIGRTARAGRDGVALSFCDADERSFLRDIERTIRQVIPKDTDHPYHSEIALKGIGGSPAKLLGRTGGGQSQPRGSSARPISAPAGRGETRVEQRGERNQRPAQQGASSRSQRPASAAPARGNSRPGGGGLARNSRNSSRRAA